MGKESNRKIDERAAEEIALIERWADMTVAERRRELPKLSAQERKVVSDGLSE